MKTVMVTRLASVPPTRRSVWSISANTRCVWASKLPEMSLPSPSTVAVWPASQTTRPPSVTTAGEYARFFCASVLSRYFAMAAPFSRIRDCGEYRTLVADPRRERDPYGNIGCRSWSYPDCPAKGWWRIWARGLAITVVATDIGYARLTCADLEDPERVRALAQAGSLARAPKESGPRSLVRPTPPSRPSGDNASDPASPHDRTCARSRSATGPFRRRVVRHRRA